MDTNQFMIFKFLSRKSVSDLMRNGRKSVKNQQKHFFNILLSLLKYKTKVIVGYT